MRAILLAAGKGTRISKKIPAVPKCTLDVNGKPLIIRTIDMLLSHHIEVTLVIGYQHHVIEELMLPYRHKITLVYNPFFDVTNSIGSLWMAKDCIIDDDTIIANADVFWGEQILEQIMLEKKKQMFLLSDKMRADDGDYFFLEEHGKIVKYGKELKRYERNCEYVGIAYISKSSIKLFKNRLIEMIEQQKHNCWWENVLYSFTREQDIYCIDVEGKFWAEIDFIEDYQRIVEHLKDKGEN